MRAHYFCTLASTKAGCWCRYPLLPPPPTDSGMTASLHSSKTATTDQVQDHDPEALGNVLTAPTEKAVNDSGNSPSPWEVTLEKSEDPKNMAGWYKWVIVLTVSSGAMCVTSASSMASHARDIRLPPGLRSNALALAGRFCRDRDYGGVWNISHRSHLTHIPLFDGFGNWSSTCWAAIRGAWYVARST